MLLQHSLFCDEKLSPAHTMSQNCSMAQSATRIQRSRKQKWTDQPGKKVHLQDCDSVVISIIVIEINKTISEHMQKSEENEMEAKEWRHQIYTHCNLYTIFTLCLIFPKSINIYSALDIARSFNSHASTSNLRHP